MIRIFVYQIIFLTATAFSFAAPVAAANSKVSANSGHSSGKEAPSCAAVSFRPLISGGPDGEQDAGLYKSRFSKIELKALVKSGEPQTYYMVLNGKKAEPLASGAPKSAEACLKSKNINIPIKTQSPNCTGERFRVAIASSAGEKMAMLFGLKGKEWLFCSASKL